MLHRPALQTKLALALGRSRAVVLAGPRQSGKTTLARSVLPADSPHNFDLENPLDAARLDEPMATLAPLQGLVVIDEVQRRPGLFPALRVLLDRSNAPGQFLLLGSASPALLRQAGESLLGRVETIEVTGFDLQEAAIGGTFGGRFGGTPDGTPDGSFDAQAAARLWLRGGFPRPPIRSLRSRRETCRLSSCQSG